MSATAPVGHEPIDVEAEIWLSPGDPRRSELCRNPHGFYDRLRQHDPVYRSPDGRWLLTSYESCAQMLGDRRMSHRMLRVPAEEQTLAHRIFMGSMLFQDPPVHTRLRRTVSTLFTPRAVERVRQRAADISRQLLQGVRDGETFDFRAGPAFRLPVLVIAEMLGLPPEDFDEFRVWAEVLLFLDEHEHPAPRELEWADGIARGALDYFTAIIEERRRRPGDDLISGLLTADDGDAALSDEELVAMCVVLHIGGHTTTQDLLTSGVYNMNQHPESFAILRRSPAAIPTAVEEFLRYESPVGVTPERVASEDLEIGGHVVPRGSVVHALLAAANRDPAIFQDPNRFDVTRTPNKHLAFATGNHVCIGAHLARVEAQEFLRVLTSEFPELRVAVPEAELEWIDSYLHRGLKTLPVRWLD
jgi:pimeloyl-[acyl-carrier protein] synthase